MRKKVITPLLLPSPVINRNWRLKVYGIDACGKHINKLVGVAGLMALVEQPLLNRLLERAIACQQDVCHCKLRRGLRVSFYGK